MVNNFWSKVQGKSALAKYLIYVKIVHLVDVPYIGMVFFC